MTDETYNGWTNYQTWNVSLWLSNDEGLYYHWMDEARRVRDESELSDLLKDAILEGSPIDYPCMYSDILNESLKRVNWREIARGMLNELEEDD